MSDLIHMIIFVTLGFIILEFQCIYLYYGELKMIDSSVLKRFSADSP